MTLDLKSQRMDRETGRLMGRRGFCAGVIVVCLVALVMTFWLGRSALQNERQDLKREAVTLASLASGLEQRDGRAAMLLRDARNGGLDEARYGIVKRSRNSDRSEVILAFDATGPRGAWRAFERLETSTAETPLSEAVDKQFVRPRSSMSMDLPCANSPDGSWLTALAASSLPDGSTVVAAVSRSQLEVLAPYHWIGGVLAIAAAAAALVLWQIHSNAPINNLPTTPAQAEQLRVRDRVVTADQLWLDLANGEFRLPREWRRDVGLEAAPDTDDRQLWERLLHPKDREPARSAMYRLASGITDRVDVVLRFARADGGYADTLCCLRAERSVSEGRVFAISGAMLDVSGLAVRLREARDALRNAKAANASKSRFLATMSHEIRTPLNAIIGFTETLSARYFGPLNQRQSEYLEDIHTAARHLLDLINDILDYSRIEAGELELTPEPISLELLVSDVRRLHRVLAEKAGVSLTASTAKSLPRVMADRRAMVQVLTNLVSNAIKFTPREGSVAVSAAQTADGVMLQVADTGAGIPADVLPEITRPFRMVDAGRRPDAEGTGLGLSIVKRLIDLHDGTLSIESSEGRGTTVTITLPRKRVVHSVPAGRQAPKDPDLSWPDRGDR